ncbi:MAG TPA: penicillin-binding protein 2 [Solirubrobacterales bacterium]|jgi:peptidoglycan glycosyltransferase|nr:penicillin-binding protein 2 [Solirubrobacterales bacterium]
MNRQIVKLFAFIVVLFGVLVGFTSYWSVFDAEALKEKDANKRPLFEQQQIERGRILTADGVVIAKSVPEGSGDSLAYLRRYPEGALFGHPIGYSFIRYGDSEFEAFHNDTLVGEEGEFSSILDELTGAKQEGNDIVTNIDSEAQRVALADLEAAGFGAVVAIEPKSGRVEVMASNKPYDPNRIPDEYGELNANELETPLLNRATQGRYPPGSTFKVVTAAAALENDVISPDTAIEAPSPLEVEGNPLSNDFNTSYPPVTLDYALTNSINTWFAKVGQDVGGDALFEQMRKFGFGSTPPIDLPDDQVYVSGVSEGLQVLGPGDPVDVGRVAIGQERLLATPLQMAMVAAAVANKGKLMKPQIWSRVVDPDGRTTEKLDPSEYSQAISAETAEQLTTAMEGVVREGTGTNAAISGVAVAGKTGTAETPFNKSCGGGEDENQAWFIGFAPADDPQVAIAASVECTPEFGGDVAAPIFRDVAEALLDNE